MGGSSNSGGGNYETGASQQEQEAMRQQSGYLQQQAGYGAQMGNLANSQGIQNLTQSGLTNAEQMQIGALDVGQQRAQDTITQNVREQSSARGLYSSAGAIGQEAAGLANLDVQKSQNIADIYGNAQQRQFQGYGLQSGLLSGAGGIYGNVASGYGQQVGAYQNSRNMNNQAQQQQNQYNQYQQQQQYGNIRNAVGLIGAPFTGGMSLGLTK